MAPEIIISRTSILGALCALLTNGFTRVTIRTRHRLPTLYSLTMSISFKTSEHKLQLERGIRRTGQC
jgi:hypothetical protein